MAPRGSSDYFQNIWNFPFFDIQEGERVVGSTGPLQENFRPVHGWGYQEYMGVVLDKVVQYTTIMLGSVVKYTTIVLDSVVKYTAMVLERVVQVRLCWEAEKITPGGFLMVERINTALHIQHPPHLYYFKTLCLKYIKLMEACKTSI